MSKAENAYEAAQREIERVELGGGTALRLSGGAFNELDRLPPELAGLTSLQHLGLNGTKVVDLSPLAGLIGLQSLGLDGTLVNDVAPLSNLTGLQHLALNATQVSDLAPLAGLTGLQHLGLDGTQVTDLTPLGSLTGLQRLRLQGAQVSNLSSLAGLTGIKRLRLDGTQISDLAPLAGLTSLQHLQLAGAQVSDLAPLAGLTGLQNLELDNTRVSDLTPLAGLTGLRSLWLAGTRISDLGPLAGLTELQHLEIDKTRVTDLAPLAGLTKLKVLRLEGSRVSDLRHIAAMGNFENGASYLGLHFRFTPATKFDARLAFLAEIPDDDERVRETLAYLRSLPPWPEPYTPKATPDGRPPEPIGGAGETARIPASRPAPLEVEINDGALRPKPSASPLAGDKDTRARQAWGALKNSLVDLADLRPRIGNQLPALNRVLTRLDQALAQDYDAGNQIELGMLGDRVIAQAQAADETMETADAAELKAFAAALAVFLERLPNWKAYRDEDIAPASAPLGPAVLDALGSIVEGLRDRDGVDALIPQKLDEQVKDVRDDPDNALLRRGLLDSANNVVGTIAEAVLKGGGWVVGEVKEVAGRYWRELKDHGSKTAARWTVRAVPAGCFVGLLVANAPKLRALAQASPEQFGWLLRFLQIFGL